jgi:hypothetical protein
MHLTNLPSAQPAPLFRIVARQFAANSDTPNTPPGNASPGATKTHGRDCHDNPNLPTLTHLRELKHRKAGEGGRVNAVGRTMGHESDVMIGFSAIGNKGCWFVVVQGPICRTRNISKTVHVRMRRF